MIPPLKILLLEDSESDAGLIIKALSRSNIIFNSMLVDTREEFITALEKFSPDVILSDHSLPQFNSLDAYMICKERNLRVPFILVTGTVSEEFAVKCLQEGIDDYILKYDLTRLPTAIVNAINKKNLEIKKKELEFEQLINAEKLKRQNELLVKTNKELDRFVYSASHELKAPLKSILGLIKLTQMELIKREYEHFEEYLRLMEVNIDRLGNTIEEIIYYSINNRTDISKEAINIEELVNKVWEKLSYIQGAESIEKILKIERTSEWYSDEYRLSIILTNLLSNAIKFRNRTGEKPYIQICVQVTPSKVFLTIEDNGIGIPAQFQEKIFEMFYRASSLSDGPGLGLYIVKETLEKLNGKIRVHSNSNKGAVFYLELSNFLS